MNKNQKGRLPKRDIKEAIKSLREKDMSFAEIGNVLKISRQLAFYHHSYKIKRDK
jgi:hypothetical protein